MVGVRGGRGAGSKKLVTSVNRRLHARTAIGFSDSTHAFGSLQKKKKTTSFGQPTRLITCANHGNEVILS